MKKPTDAEFYRSMLRIRRFEETVLAMFPRGLFYGTTHTYIGQEADAAGVLSLMGPGDVVVSNHRCHGHFLAYGGSMHALAAELMGKRTGVCGGRGGSQHIQWKNFYANGILGGTVPLAVGMALAEKQRSKSAVVFSFIGDGTLGEGVVYESLNLASLWGLPILFVLENNRYAQSTPIERHLAGEIAARFAAFGIPAAEMEALDPAEIYDLAAEGLARVREEGRPGAIVLHTYRFAPHSKGDDMRDPDEIARYRARDPLLRVAKRLEAGERVAIEERVTAEVEGAFEQAEADPAADPQALTPPLGGPA